jgi:hypothetical protein
MAAPAQVETRLPLSPCSLEHSSKRRAGSGSNVKPRGGRAAPGRSAGAREAPPLLGFPTLSPTGGASGGHSPTAHDGNRACKEAGAVPGGQPIAKAVNRPTVARVPSARAAPARFECLHNAICDAPIACSRARREQREWARAPTVTIGRWRRLAALSTLHDGGLPRWVACATSAAREIDHEREHRRSSDGGVHRMCG